MSSRPVRYCEYCGRETVVKREEFSLGQVQVWAECPRFGWSLFSIGKHTSQFCRIESGFTGNYNPYTGMKNG